MLAVALAIAYSFNKMITNPIQELLDMVKHLQEREFGRLVLVRSEDEIGQLSRAFNELSETLEDLFLQSVTGKVSSKPFWAASTRELLRSTSRGR